MTLTVLVKEMGIGKALKIRTCRDSGNSGFLLPSNTEIVETQVLLPYNTEIVETHGFYCLPIQR